MTKRNDALAAKESMINVLLGVTLMLLLTILFLGYGLVTGRDTFRVNIPADLRNGAVVNIDEYNVAKVYAFANVVFRSLNRWENNGFTDYGKRIDELAPYLSNDYYAFLQADMNFKHSESELENRTRYAIETGNDNDNYEDVVRVINDDAWVVSLTVRLVEYIGDFETKNRTITYPLIIRRGNIDPINNVWGLVIDGYPKGEKPITEPEQQYDITG